MNDHEQAVEVYQPQQALTVFGTDDPAAIVQRVVAIATPLAEFIHDRNMTTEMGNRTHVNIEGWSFMGAMMGIAPVVTRVSELKDAEGHLCGFEAQVELRTRDGAIVGGGIGECSRSEEMWGWNPRKRNGEPLPPRDDFALKSMAQTRATGKAFRLGYGFIMKAAGYDSTPTEEMGDYAPETPRGNGQQQQRSTQQGRRVDNGWWADLMGEARERRVSTAQLANVTEQREGESLQQAAARWLDANRDETDPRGKLIELAAATTINEEG